MKSFQDYTAYSTNSSDVLAPKARKQLPFPLENFDEEVTDAYIKVEGLLRKLLAAEQNPVNKTPARKRRLKNLKYKVKTCINLIKELSAQCQELWF